VVLREVLSNTGIISRIMRLHDVDHKTADLSESIPRHSAKQLHRRLPPNEVERLVDDYNAGTLVRDLAAQFGIHRNTVSAILDRMGVQRRY